jgi:hypothetical protein
MVKIVDMREALQQVREKAPNTADEGFKTVGNQKGTEFKVYKNDKLVKTFSTYIQAHDYVKQKEDLDKDDEKKDTKKKLHADSGSKLTKVETEPSVDYKN